jgi:hypothetical protein
MKARTCRVIPVGRGCGDFVFWDDAASVDRPLLQKRALEPVAQLVRLCTVLVPENI